MNRKQHLSVLFALYLSVLHIRRGAGQGRLQLPLGRSSVWRAKMDTPKNYDDHMLNCGGLGYKIKRGNQCGVCGDPVDRPRENENGGKFDTGIITGSYSPGQHAQFKVLMNSNRGGFMEFKLCPEPWASQECFDRFPIPMADGSGNRYYLSKGEDSVSTIDVFIPPVTCEHCVMQWSYTGSDNWGYDYNGEECEGCGPQYELRNCADISITPDGFGSNVPKAIQIYNNAETGGLNPRGTYHFDPSVRTFKTIDDFPSQSHSPFAPPTLGNDYPDPWVDPRPPVRRPSPGRSRMRQFPPRGDQSPFSSPNPDPWVDAQPPPRRGPFPYAPPQNSPDPWVIPPQSNSPFAPPDIDIPVDPWVGAPDTDYIYDQGSDIEEPRVTCVAIGTKTDMEGMDKWCTENCNSGYCPDKYCSCW